MRLQVTNRHWLVILVEDLFMASNLTVVLSSCIPRDLLEARVNKTLPFKLENAIKVRPPGTETTAKRTNARR